MRSAMTSAAVWNIKWSIRGILLLLVLRKILLGYRAMNYVAQCQDQISFEALMSDKKFEYVTSLLPNDTLVLFLNQHALNMTLNWLCNTLEMDNVHSHSLIVTMDAESDRVLAEAWPNVSRFHWPVKCLQNPFNYGEGAYQLFYLFRANFAAALLHKGRSFWMVQQDTFWRENLLSLNLSSTDSDILFDRADGTMGTMIAGGYYKARPTMRAKKYFADLAADLSWWYVPDNAMMASYCARKSYINCAYIPFSYITNWKWLHDRDALRSDTVPFLIQFDGDTKLGGKLAKMKNLGFYFMNEFGHQCNTSSVHAARQMVENGGNSKLQKRPYFSCEFGIYQSLIEWITAFWPMDVLFMQYVLPYGHYLMITI